MPPRRGPTADVALATLVATLAFTYRFLAHSNFNDDHFIHLVKAQAWLAGDWPTRDFTDPGMPLTYGMSAAAQWLLGPTLLSELLLSIGGLALGAAVTYWVTARLTGSRALGLLAGGLQIAAKPQLFAFPKFLVYPVLVALCLHYARRQTGARLAVIAGWVVLAFLIRHDHGVYGTIGAITAVSCVHGRDGLASVLRAAALLAVFIVGGLTPYLCYVQAQMGVARYLNIGLETSRSEAVRSRPAGGRLPTLNLERGRLFVPRPPPDPEELPGIRIRWGASVTDEARRRFEARGSLLAGELTDTRTWAYRVDPDQLDRVRDILNDSAVEDLAGIDRQATLTGWRPTVGQALRAFVPSLTIGPPLVSAFTARNLSVILLYVCWAMAPVALGLWWLTRRRLVNEDSSERRAGTLLVPALCALNLASTAGLLRLDVLRVPDVFGTFPVLLCWVVTTLFSLRGSLWRFAARGVAMGVVAIVTTFLLVGGDSDLVADAVADPKAALNGIAETVRSSRDWPWPGQWPKRGGWTLARYVHECTNPDDRLVVTWAAPEYYYFSKRVFAGREGALFPVSRSPSSYEGAVLESWTGHRVPIVLTRDDEYENFSRAFPRLAAHLESAYRKVGAAQQDEGPAITVHVDRQRTVSGPNAELGLPCLATGPSAQ